MSAAPDTRFTPEQLQKYTEGCKPGTFFRAEAPKKTLQLTGGLTYCRKLQKEGKTFDDNPFVYHEGHRIVGYADDIATVTGMPMATVIAESIDPLTEQGKGVIEAAIRDRRQISKEQELSFEDVLFILDHITENKADFVQKTVKTASTVDGAPKRRRRRGSLPSMIRDVILQQGDGLNHVISISRFNLENASGCHFVTMTKNERDNNFSRTRNRRPEINGQVLPIRIGASEANQQSAEAFCQYLETLDTTEFGGVTFGLVAQAIRDCVRDNAALADNVPLPPEPLQRQPAASKLQPRKQRSRKPSEHASASAVSSASAPDDVRAEANKQEYFDIDEYDDGLDDGLDGYENW